MVKFVERYADLAKSQLGLIIDSTGMLSVVKNLDFAAKELGVSESDAIAILPQGTTITGRDITVESVNANPTPVLEDVPVAPQSPAPVAPQSPAPVAPQSPAPVAPPVAPQSPAPIQPLPVAQSPAPQATTSVCNGGTIELFGLPNIEGASYLWTGPNGYISGAQNPVIANVTPAQSGQYSLIITTDCDSDSVAVNIDVFPSISSSVAVSICAGQTYFAGGADQSQSGSYVDVTCQNYCFISCL